MNLIAAVDINWGIGCSGNLLFNIPEDMDFFRNKTLDKVVIMGYETFKSLPGAKALKKRINIVLSKNESLMLENANVCNNIPELMETVKLYNTDDVFIIGGQSIYEQMLNYCAFAYITKIKTESKADKYFPNIDDMDNWKIIYESEEKCFKDLKYNFLKYKNLSINN